MNTLLLGQRRAIEAAGRIRGRGVVELDCADSRRCGRADILPLEQVRGRQHRVGDVGVASAADAHGSRGQRGDGNQGHRDGEVMVRVPLTRLNT